MTWGVVQINHTSADRESFTTSPDLETWKLLSKRHRCHALVVTQSRWNHIFPRVIHRRQKKIVLTFRYFDVAIAINCDSIFFGKLGTSPTAHHTVSTLYSISGVRIPRFRSKQCYFFLEQNRYYWIQLTTSKSYYDRKHRAKWYWNGFGSRVILLPFTK